MATWGLVPAAGAGTRIQPLAFSKELLPLAVRDGNGTVRPRAVGEFIVERFIAAGADRLCFVIAPGKSDIVQYFGGAVSGVPICYVLQDRPAGLCDAVFRADLLIHPDDRVLIGLPDTVWFPVDALTRLPADDVALLLFPVAQPALFDAVVTRADGTVVEIQVKVASPTSNWVWGAIGMPGHAFLALRELWASRGCSDEYLGQLLNAWITGGHRVAGVRAGEVYVDVGTVHGYREALAVLDGPTPGQTAAVSSRSGVVAKGFA
jgi:dTDP-glucose pyrophosphorylase